MSELTVERNDELSRYEGSIQGELACVIDFIRIGKTIIVTHTGTEPAWRGRGLAAEINAAMLDDVRTQGLKVKAQCPYTIKFLSQHPEYADLIST